MKSCPNSSALSDDKGQLTKSFSQKPLFFWLTEMDCDLRRFSTIHKDDTDSFSHNFTFPSNNPQNNETTMNYSPFSTTAMMNNCSLFFYNCYRPDLSKYDAPTSIEQSTFKRNNKRNYRTFTIQQTNVVAGASTSKRARTIPIRCKRNLSDLIKYNQSEEEEVKEELALSPRKKYRIALKCHKNKINKLKVFNFTNPNEGTGVSTSQKVRSVPARSKRNLNNLYKYNQSKNESPKEKYIKSTCYLKKLSLTQSQDELNNEQKCSHDSEMDWRYDSSMDWRHDSELDCWIYESEMDWSYDSSMDWSYDLEYQQ